MSKQGKETENADASRRNEQIRATVLQIQQHYPNQSKLNSSETASLLGINHRLLSEYISKKTSMKDLTNRFVKLPNSSHPLITVESLAEYCVDSGRLIPDADTQAINQLVTKDAKGNFILDCN